MSRPMQKNVLATPTNLKSSARMVEARQPQPQEGDINEHISWTSRPLFN